MKIVRISRRPNAFTSNDRTETVTLANKATPIIGFHGFLPHSQTNKQQASEKQPTATSIAINPTDGICEIKKRKITPMVRETSEINTIFELETIRDDRGRKADGISLALYLYANKNIVIKMQQRAKNQSPVLPGSLK